jgi:hypothetical protein
VQGLCVAGELAVTSPNGGERFVAGQLVDISWVATANIDTVDITLMRDGSVVEEIAAGVPNSGAFQWTIPFTVADADGYQIEIGSGAGSAGKDDSDVGFFIGNWLYRRELTVSSAAADARQDFAILLAVDPASFVFANAAAGGADVRFASDAARSRGYDVAHWVESWTGDGARVWVRVPAIPAGGQTALYMYYGLSEQVATTSDFAATFPRQMATTGDVTLSGVMEFDAVTIGAGHTVAIGDAEPLDIRARIITVDGTVQGTGGGYPGGSTAPTPGAGPGGGGASTDAGGGGGGHGGVGGRGGRDLGDSPGAGGLVQGAADDIAVAVGSGGGGTNLFAGGAGGGAVALRAYQLTVTGDVIVDGVEGGGGANQIQLRGGGGGAGGSILLIGHDVRVSSTLSARGGAGGSGDQQDNDGGGGGGGGRIKIVHREVLEDSATKLVAGGAGGTSGSLGDFGEAGAAGTVHVASNPLPDEPVSTLGPEEPAF